MTPYKVEIIEDDETSKRLVGHFVEKEGFVVVTAANGREGLEVFQKEKPDIIITDLKMPEMNGIELMRSIRQMNSPVSIILVTGFGDYETAIASVREGALDYLKKPINLDELAVALGRAKEKVTELKKTTLYPTLLLMEDDEMTRVNLANFLEKEHYHVLQAHDGQEGVELFLNNKVDIALIDINMPKKNGLDTLHEIRRITDDFEVIVFTGYGDEETAVQAMRDGAGSFLKKPIDLDQLSVSIERSLDKLSVSRSLKFRTRELALAREVIAKITPEAEILIDARLRNRDFSRNFALRVLDSLPLNILVVDRDLNVLYANAQTRKFLKDTPEKFDEEIAKQMGFDGTTDGGWESAVAKINNIFTMDPGKTESLVLNSQSTVSLMKVAIIGEDITQNAVIIFSRKP